ncbi:MAG: CPBP family glutamic-type intramembrane protease [Coriobacteriales bacterium]|nr:CPBP family glutamic-type intramembrane protease [Coriobacteriales bacterium]
MKSTDSTKDADAALQFGGKALSDMPGCVVVLGHHGRIVYANDSACELLAIKDFVNKPFGAYFSAYANSENDAFYEMFLEAVRNKEARHQGRCPFVAPDGTRYTLFVTSSHLKTEDETYLVITCANVSAEERSEQMRRESTLVFLSSIVYMCTFVFIYAVWNYLGRPFAPRYLTRILEVGGVALGFFVYKRSSLTLADLGLGTKNLAHNLKVDGIACLAIVVFFCAVKLVAMRVIPGHITHPETFYDPSWVSPMRFVRYIFTAVVQEFLSRGIMQESLCHVIVGKHRERMAIAVSTIMFAALHLHYSPFFMLGAALLLGVFGIIYQRQRSIWGLALIHFTFGMSAGMLGLI